ncbi:MAG: hypothetical protein RLZZ156_493 [Deinococcota bacterium]|jgi:hypothetical protein
MKKLAILAVIPLLAGCELLGSLIPSDNLVEVRVTSSLPSFQYLIPGDTIWQTVPTVSLGGELVTKEVTNSVITSSTLNPNGVSIHKTRAGSQTLLGTLRSNAVIAEGRKDISAGTGASNEVSLTFDPVLTRVVIPPSTPSTTPSSEFNLEYWVMGPVYRVLGDSAYTPQVSVTGAGELVSFDKTNVRVRVKASASAGQTINILIAVNGMGTQTISKPSASTILNVQ